MAIFNPNNLDWNGKEVMASSEAIFIEAFQNPEFSQLFTVVTGIKAKQQIAILGRLNQMLGLGTGACINDGGDTSRTVDSPTQQKLWEPEIVGDQIGLCYTDLDSTFFVWGRKNGIQAPDLTGTDFLLFLESLLTTELKEMILRLFYFGDKDAELIADGGVVTNTVNIAYVNRIDGIWKQVFGIVAGDSARKTVITGTTRTLTSINAQATYAQQAFNNTDTTELVVTKTLTKMTEDADSRLMAKANKRFYVTKSVYDQYKRELKFANVNYTTERIENGVPVLNCDGIELVLVEFWDRMIKLLFNTTTNVHLPHRILLASPENLQLGTEEEANLSQYDVFFDKRLKKTFVDMQMNLDAKVVLDHEIQVAY